MRHLKCLPVLTSALMLTACSGSESDSTATSLAVTMTTSGASTSESTPSSVVDTTDARDTTAAVDTTVAVAEAVDGELTLSTPSPTPTGVDATTSTLTYRMLGAAGGMVEATATLMTPIGDVPSGGWPLMVWSGGSSGLADACATGASPGLLGQAAFLSPVIAAGVAVVVPNYEGLGAAGPATFRDSGSLAHATIGAARAARAAGGVADRYALAGYSLGGQAALAAAEQAPQLAPDLSLVRVMAIAPAAGGEAQSAHFDEQVADALAAGDPGTASILTATKTALLSYLIVGLSVRNPELQLTDFLGVNATALASKVTEACIIDLIVAFLGDIAAFTASGASVADYAGIMDEWFDEPAMAAALAANVYGTSKIAAPVVVVHGPGDQVVPNSATLATVSALQEAGSDVTYVSTTATDHFGQFNDAQAAAERDRLVQVLLSP